MDDYKNKTDEEIVDLVRKGNKELYTHIIVRFQARLTRYAGYLLGDPDKTDDVVQESFIKAFINLNGFDTRKKFSSWIYRIVHNEAMNLIDKNKKFIRIESDMDFDSKEDIEDAYMKEELIKYARQCLDQMELMYREPLSLYYLEERSYDEISDILRLPPGTVATRIKRAKILMKKICQTQTK